MSSCRIQSKSLSLVALSITACAVPVAPASGPYGTTEGDPVQQVATIEGTASPTSARHRASTLDVCATCAGSLGDFCANGACPPSLGTTEFEQWCAEVPGKWPVVASHCGGLLIVMRGTGVDCASSWAYDEASGALVGVMDVKCGSLETSCTANDVCVPQCCVDGSCGTPAPSPCAP